MMRLRSPCATISTISVFARRQDAAGVARLLRLARRLPDGRWPALSLPPSIGRSPLWTRRTQSSSVSGSDAFSTSPWAPRCAASTTSSSPIARRQDDDAAPRRRSLQFAEHLETAASRHPHVEHQHVGVLRLHRPQRFVAGAAAGDHREAHIAVEQPLQAVQHDRVVVGEDDADRHGSRLSGRERTPPAVARRRRRLPQFTRHRDERSRARTPGDRPRCTRRRRRAACCSGSTRRAR